MATSTIPVGTLWGQLVDLERARLREQHPDSPDLRPETVSFEVRCHECRLLNWRRGGNDRADLVGVGEATLIAGPLVTLQRVTRRKNGMRSGDQPLNVHGRSVVLPHPPGLLTLAEKQPPVPFRCRHGHDLEAELSQVLAQLVRGDRDRVYLPAA